MQRSSNCVLEQSSFFPARSLITQPQAARHVQQTANPKSISASPRTSLAGSAAVAFIPFQPSIDLFPPPLRPVSTKHQKHCRGLPCLPCKFLQALSRGIICFIFLSPRDYRCISDHNIPSNLVSSRAQHPSSTPTHRPTACFDRSASRRCATTLPSPASWRRPPTVAMAPQDTYFDDEEDCWYEASPVVSPTHPRPPPDSCSRPSCPLTARATALCASRSLISPTATSDHVLVDIRYADACAPARSTAGLSRWAFPLTTSRSASFASTTSGRI